MAVHVESVEIDYTARTVTIDNAVMHWNEGSAPSIGYGDSGEEGHLTVYLPIVAEHVHIEAGGNPAAPRPRD